MLPENAETLRRVQNKEWREAEAKRLEKEGRQIMWDMLESIAETHEEDNDELF